MKNIAFTPLTLCLCLAFGGSAWAADLYVSVERQHNHYNTLLEALNAAQDQDTIILKKDVVEDYRLSSNSSATRQAYRIDKAVTIRGDNPGGHQVLRFDGYNDIVLSKNVTLKDVELFIQPTESSLSDAISGAGTGTANELDPNIYLNGHKLVLDNVKTTPTVAQGGATPHEFTRPNIYLGAYNNEQDAGKGTLEVTNTSNTTTNTELKHIVANSAESAISLNTQTDVKKDIHLASDKTNGQGLSNKVVLYLDKYRKPIRVQKAQGGDPKISLTANNTQFNSFPNGLETLENLTLEGDATLPVTSSLTVTDTLTLNGSSAKLSVGNNFADDDDPPITVNVNNITGNGGNLSIEGESRVTVTGTLDGTFKVADSTSNKQGFTAPDNDRYEKVEGEDGSVTYQPKTESPPPSHNPPPADSSSGQDEPAPSDPPSTGDSTPPEQPSEGDTGSSTPPDNGQTPPEDNPNTGDGSNTDNDNPSNEPTQPEDTPSDNPSDDGQPADTPTQPGTDAPSDGSNPNEPGDSPKPEEGGEPADEPQPSEPGDNPKPEEGGEPADEPQPSEPGDSPKPEEGSEPADEPKQPEDEPKPEAPKPSAPKPPVKPALPSNAVIFNGLVNHLLLGHWQQADWTGPQDGRALWVSIDSSVGRQQSVDGLGAYRSLDTRLRLGTEQRLKHAVVGLSFNAQQLSLRHDQGSSLQARAFNSTVYGQLPMGRLQAQWQAGATLAKVHTARRIGNDTATANYPAKALHLGAGLAYPMSLSLGVLTPTLKAQYAYVNSSAYTEVGSTQALSVPSQITQSLIVRPGLNLTWPISERWHLSAKADVGRELLTGEKALHYRAGSQALSFDTTAPYQWYGNATLNAQYRFSHGSLLQMSLHYAQKSGHGQRHHQGTLGVKWLY